ncbi:hypothetical protein L596_000280 [Steinernema carpocapsae]|uniref:Uncharacterized protein n=1 Tax=Steinernema carpocapsae TaxID=34508 RepID=A0A4U8UIA8_STECR|nr:hypothetical protein L596_000280 [Steinernema carpocapsae]
MKISSERSCADSALVQPSQAACIPPLEFHVILTLISSRGTCHFLSVQRACFFRVFSNHCVFSDLLIPHVVDKCQKIMYLVAVLTVWSRHDDWSSSVKSCWDTPAAEISFLVLGSGNASP